MAQIKLTIGRLRDAWLAYPEARQAIAQFPTGPPVFVGGTHRSGTTWFASMLAEPGLWYIHEPFNPNKGIWPEEFTYASPDENRKDINQYMQGLLAGHYRSTANNPNTDHWMMPLRILWPPIRRTMIKDPLACLLTGYLAKHFALQTRILFRHPAGFASSVLRLGWPIGKFLKDFLKRPTLMQDHLQPYVTLLERHQNRDDAAAAAVLHGVLNVVQWNQLQKNTSIGYYIFEDLCQDPLGSFEKIFAEFGLPYTDATRDRHIRLCMKGSSEPSDYHTHAVARNSAAMADSWKSQLTPKQVTEVRLIWNEFRIPLYSEDSQWQPTKNMNYDSPQ